MPFEQFRYLVPNWLDIVEILAVAYVIYRLLMFLVGTRALQILIGLISLGLIYFIAAQFNLNMIATLLGFVFTYGIFAAIVLFQPELRHAFSQLGRTKAVQFFTGASQSAAAEAVTEAAERLSRTGTGALIAVEGEVSLTDYVDTVISSVAIYSKPSPAANSTSGYRSSTLQIIVGLPMEASDTISLQTLKVTPGLEDMMVNRRGARLSIQPVKPEEWNIVMKLARSLIIK